MTGVFPHQIAKAFVDVYSGASAAAVSLRALIPGSLWYGPVNPDTTIPYGTIAVTQQAREVDSKGVVETNLVTLSVYSATGVTAGGAILSALAEICREQNVLAFDTIPGVQVLRIRSESPEAEIQDQRRAAADVLAGRIAFRFVTNTPKG